MLTNQSAAPVRKHATPFGLGIPDSPKRVEITCRACGEKVIIATNRQVTFGSHSFTCAWCNGKAFNMKGLDEIATEMQH